jgi:Polymer-forming cytoskeletal
MFPPANHSPRTVTCYHCGAPIESTAAARSTSCPTCNKRIVLDDMLIEVATMWSGPIETCGRVIIGPAARLSTRLIAAAESIEISGIVTSRLSCKGLVSLNTGSTFKGDCQAAALEVERGAVLSGFFQVGAVNAAPSPAA